MAQHLLIDRLRGACIDPNHRLKLPDGLRPENLSRLSATLSRARVFDVEDAVVDLANDLSSVEPRALLSMLALARPPYQTTWIEIDPGAGDTERAGSERLGWLLETFDQRGRSVMRVSQAMVAGVSAASYAGVWSPEELNDPAVCELCTLSFLVDPEVPEPTHILDTRARDVADLYENLQGPEGEKGSDVLTRNGLVRHFALRALLSDAYLTHHLERAPDAATEHGERLEAVRSLGRHVAFVRAPHVPRDFHPTKTGSASFAYGRCLSQYEGKLRLLLALLAVINSQSVVSDPMKGGGRMEVRGRRVQYLAHHRVRLAVPKGRAERDFPAQWSSGRQVRAHEVRGTLCYSRDTDRTCQHAFVRREDGRGEICTRCRGRRWWRRPHVRGDGRRGLVTKDYWVTRK